MMVPDAVLIFQSVWGSRERGQVYALAITGANGALWGAGLAQRGSRVGGVVQQARRVRAASTELLIPSTVWV